MLGRRFGMNVKLLPGIVLFLIGLATAVVGIAEVGRNDAGPAAVVEDSRSLNLSEGAGRMIIPLISGLSLAIGDLVLN
jgi:uncharacterized membrane protein